MSEGVSIDPNSSIGIEFNQLFLGGLTLYAIPTTTALGLGNHRELQRLFTIPAILLTLLFVAEKLTPLYALFSSSSTILFFVISQISLLLAYHLYSSMARIGRIPFLFARPQRKEFILLVEDILLNQE
ncbi:MAG TPA: hypothetical protein VJ869_17225, partial [Sphaerochaeta sp.]|nr:hypothetical protein [Sphaerochaeta sp.]